MMTMDYALTTTGDADGSPKGNVEIGAPWQRPDAGLVEQFARYGTAQVGDAQGRLGMPDGGLSPIWEGCRAVGGALTVLTVAGDDLAVIEAVAHVQPGDLVVINGFGYQGRALMGDILAHYFTERGAVGAIVDGAVRDRDDLRKQGFPVWSRGVVPAGPWKNGPGAVATPVAIGGVVVNPGDIVVADADGIVVVPLSRARRTAAELPQIAQRENDMRHQAKSSVAQRGS
ncbi:RraA family protein [Terrabacter sp. GCM10028922]|uniref:RraA family protein n=1 Tax=Terrabacter sp. GCM10028922 TaxID=3273428 RepID=UPI00361F43A3